MASAQHRLPAAGNAPSRERRETCAQRPERRGQRHMQPDRGALFAGIERSSAAASARSKLGATTMTEVALMRPRAIRSRIAALTPGEMP